MHRVPLLPLLLMWLVLTTFLLSACGNEAGLLVLSDTSPQAAGTGVTVRATPRPTSPPIPTPTIPVAPRPTSPLSAPTIASDKDFKITTGYVYYEIHGATPGDLRDQMNRLGPADSTGRRFDGRTDWYIDWHYSYNGTNTGCKIATTEVDVKVTFTLPHWAPPNNISPGLVEKWDKYMVALQSHEDGHKNNALSSGQAILRAFKALPPYPDCDEVKQNISATGQRIIKQANQNDLDYDAQTKHGATQGATFP
jgi:predicted secreted Zn-dependent protease